MQGKGLLLRGRCSIVNSHGEQVHVNESFCCVVSHYHFKTVYSSFLFLSCSPRFFHSFLLRAMLTSGLLRDA